MAWTFINSISTENVNNGPDGTSGSVDMTGADFLCVIGSGYAGINQGAMTCADSQSNVYTANTVYDGGGSNKVQAFWKFGPSVGSSMTFTVSGTSSFPSVTAFGFSGGATGSLDTSVNSVMDGSNSAWSVGPLTPAQGDELFIAGTSFIGSGFAARTFNSIDGGFTGLVQGGYDGAGNMGPGGAYEIKVADTSAESPTLTFSGNTGGANVLIAFKPSAGGGGGGKPDHYYRQLRRYQQERVDREQRIHRAYRETILRRAA